MANYWSQLIAIASSYNLWLTLFEQKILVKNILRFLVLREYFTGSGVSLSSEGDGLGVVPLELFDVVRGVLDLDSASESLHCSTSTSNSSSPSVNRFIDAGPDLIKTQISHCNRDFIPIFIFINVILC